MKLSEKQQFFTRMVARLIDQVDVLGYDGATLGESWRTREQVEINILGRAGRANLAGLIKGHYPDLAEALRKNTVQIASKRSLHPDRLAIDLLLFRNGEWLTQSEDYEPLGIWWEKQSTPEFKLAWGGRFGDGNHFSLSHAGRR